MPLPGEDAQVDGTSAKAVVPGDVLDGKWRVERTLGRGGMGQVLAARHTTLGTQVAIKVVHPELVTDPDVVARFLREAHAMARLRSEHTVRVLDVGETDANVPYIIMEYLEGRDLGAILSEHGPLPVAVAVEYARQASEALTEAHEAGIVHRDVKPHNLFLSKRGSAEVVRVLDFGLAKAVSFAPSRQLTQAGDMLGSPHYMAPEQVLGRAVDARADVWGLGATLYRLLTREFPFARGNPALVTTAVLREEPVPLRRLRPEIPEAVAAVVARCLVKDPAGRFQTMRELGAVLTRAGESLAGPPPTPLRAPMPPPSSPTFMPATPATFVPHAPPPPRSGPAATGGLGAGIAAAAVLAVLVLAGIGYGAWRNRPTAGEPRLPAPSPTSAASTGPSEPASGTPTSLPAPSLAAMEDVAPAAKPAPTVTPPTVTAPTVTAPTVTAPSLPRETHAAAHASASASASPRRPPTRPAPATTTTGGIYDSL